MSTSVTGAVATTTEGEFGTMAGRPHDVLAQRTILGMRVDATTYADAAEHVVAWSGDHRGRYVCIANVHMVMEAWDDRMFRETVNDADLVTPDGMPLVWALRRLGVSSAERVYGPTLMLHVCEAAAREGVPVGLYGGSSRALEGMRAFLSTRWPALKIAYAEAPQFLDPARPIPVDERVASDVRASGARILFVALGCPKQERWMAVHRPHLPLVQLGVGAAFDFHSGMVRQAPEALQRVGLEWAFRLAMEPRRLARRYLRHNPRFVWHLARQLLGHRFSHRRTTTR